MPFVLVSLVLIANRAVNRRRLAAYLEAAAFVAALGTTYVLALGWPVDLVFSAKSKIVIAAVGGFAAGLAFCERARWAKTAIIALVIAMPLWIGLPALQQGRPESALLLLPIAIAFTLPFLIDVSVIGDAAPDNACSKTLIAMTMTFGLAMIALFAKTFSYAELALSLASTLLAAMTIGRKQLAAPALITIAAALLAMITALLLYSQANLTAMLVLSIVIGAERLDRVACSESDREPSLKRIAIFCALPAMTAILIARIDAGPFSIY
ncbi:MAG: hypothetical protein AAGA21_00515 [Pseudomonadota bacterium]